MRSGIKAFLTAALLVSLTGCFKMGNSSADLFLGVTSPPVPPSPSPVLAIKPTAATVVVNGVIEFAGSGGTPPFTYSVVSGGGSFSGDFYTAPGSPGSAVVQVQDSGGQTANAQVTINPPLGISPASAQTTAVNDTLTFTGTGGVPPYSYLVASGGGTFSNSGIFTAPSISGTATVQVMDSEGNLSSTVTITINDALVAIPSTQTIVTSSTLSYSATGGVPPYTYTLKSGSGSLVGTTYTAPAISGAAVVKVTDSAGNTASSTLTIVAPLAITPSTQTLQINDSLTFNASGGIPPYSFLLLSGTGTLLGSTYTAPASPGSAVVQVIDSQSSTANANITINPALAISPTSKTMVTNNTASFSASGGVPPYSYSVASGGGSTSGSGYTAPTGAGGVVVRVTDAGGHTSDSSVTVLAIATPTAGATLSAGSYSGCVALSDGSARCWGNDELGQLGNGSTGIQSSTPVAVSGISAAVEIAVDGTDSLLYNHACARLNTGALQCWGDNSVGELGNGTHSGTPSSSPVSVSGITNAAQISVGIGEGCAVLNDLTVKCWGANTHGGVGNGNTVEQDTPVAVSGLSGVNSVSTGYYSSCAVLGTGGVKCWGYDSNGQLGNGVTGTDSSTPVSVSTISNATDVAVGQSHACAVLASGAVQCWGLNSSGQLGNGSTIDSNTPVTVTGISTASTVSAGIGFSCALLSSGAVKCWGTNSAGQLGAGGNYIASSTTPVAVSGITSAVAISAGGYHACALLADNSVHCWGDNSFGELGNGDSALQLAPLASMTGVASLSAVAMSPQSHHACVLQSTGAVQSSGDDLTGELGDNVSQGAKLVSGVVAATGISTASQVAAGAGFECAMLSNNSVSCWGANANGQLGNGTTSPSSTPVSVSGISTARQLAASQSTACAVLLSGAVQCWGKGANGVLGNGASSDSSTPVSVSGISTASQVAVGKDHACALLSGGAVQCWGNDGNGQLGNSTTGGTSTTPVSVTGISTAMAVVADDEATCALLAGGSVKCWGAGGNGGLGNGGTADSNAPVSVSGISTATQLSAGQYHFCALLSGGAVQCWGGNSQGQVGTGALASSVSSPQTVSGISGATAVAAGVSGSCALLSATSIECWGTNGENEFGLGSGYFGLQVAPVMALFP